MILATGTKCQYELIPPGTGGTSPECQTRGHVMENTQDTEVVLEESLIEEVSIDGMCGVY